MISVLPSKNNRGIIHRYSVGGGLRYQHCFSLDYESMAYLYDKFRVAATEVKRQVLKRKGEQVPEVPPKVKPACKSNFIAGSN